MTTGEKIRPKIFPRDMTFEIYFVNLKKDFILIQLNLLEALRYTWINRQFLSMIYDAHIVIVFLNRYFVPTSA